METVWVVAANATRARIFSGEAGRLSAVLEEIEDLVHPESRMHDRDLTSDLPGRTYESYGAARHAIEEPTTPRQHEVERFVGRIGDVINRGRRDGRFDKLYLVAAPELLGRLRKALDPETAKRIADEIRKNVSSESADGIRAYLPDRL
ncbi:MAG TPA: host attachment protein [Gammaproteobacteria bacterium]|nr:host attachment protein [Gammaproteobacteria bacterium]